ncbi:ISAs1 family transposase [Endozoicomonas sp. 4G]|uniref:ISAs1 family transposase n=1 Tax=Endozoicomonas sp. 4G TaxID=2872754 RepID=UPI002078CC47|nr:ISAs1 family transposase [Endozoicomonas sp. 4G]
MAPFGVFSELTEVRADNHRHPLPHLVFIAICMIICGAEDWNMVSELGKKKKTWLKRYIPLPHGIPSQHTFIRVFERLDPKEFRKCFIKWAQLIAERTDAVVESERHEGEKVSLERRYFISSLKTDAKEFMSSVRSHWSVENSLNWVLDIGLREDRRLQRYEG